MGGRTGGGEVGEHLAHDRDELEAVAGESTRDGDLRMPQWSA
jgi:hypothetical protein